MLMSFYLVSIQSYTFRLHWTSSKVYIKIKNTFGWILEMWWIGYLGKDKLTNAKNTCLELHPPPTTLSQFQDTSMQ
jgi:hypothetical protein